MLKAKLLAGVGVAGLLASLVVVTPAMAWHPKGVIVKKVQNITAGSQLVDANSAASAVEVKPGDIIRYVITIKNVADPAPKQNNDMAYTKLTDQVPAGVEMVDTPQTRSITENLGLIVPMKSITKEYQFKVTSKLDGAFITNTACFTGDSVVRDNPQKGCDDAVIKVKVPPVPPQPQPEQPKPEVPAPEAPKPEAPKAETPVVIPKTGPEAAVFGGVGLTSLGYAGYSAYRSRRDVIEKMLKRQ